MKDDKKKKTQLFDDALKEKVTPLLEETIEKSLGVSFPQLESDITDQLVSRPLDFYVPLDVPFKQAKKRFQREFLKQELQIHVGNISELAKALQVDRRSIHRAIKSLNIKIAEAREPEHVPEDYYRGLVDKTIRSTLEQYKEILHPQKMEQMYQEVPRLSRNIVKYLPHQKLTWKEAERMFEKHFFQGVLEKHKGNVTETARIIGIRAETLHRKLKKLELR